MRLHLAFGPDDGLLEWFRTRVGAQCRVSTGPDVPSNTTVLVSGRTNEAELSALQDLEAFIVPFAGLIPATREALLSRPGLAVYNLHHNAAATAEKALELLFAVAKRTLGNDRAMRQGSWSPRFEGSEAVQLAGRRSVVLGYGEIGRRVARACLGLGMTVTAVRRSGADGDDAVTVVPSTGFRRAVAGQDILVVCAPLTPETDGIIDAAVLGSLSDGAILVNIGRGPIVVEGDLYDALVKGKLHGAGLDVWWRYPTDDHPCPPSEFPFETLDNVVMSPHCGGTVIETETERMKALAELVCGILSGEPIAKRVDVVAGY